MFRILCLVGLAASLSVEAGRIPLEGEWTIRLDPDDVGGKQNWPDRKFADPITLPGALQYQGYGTEASFDGPWTARIGMSKWEKMVEAGTHENIERRSPVFLMPERVYVGPAWYQREITIPPEWDGLEVELFLERPHWQTAVWIDGEPVGPEQRSLGAPHRHALGQLQPGRHLLTLRVDNSLQPEVGFDAHSVSDQTQGNWNGVVGAIRLEAREPDAIRSVAVHPDPEARAVRLLLEMDAAKGRDRFTVSARGLGENDHQPEPLRIEAAWEDGRCEIDYPLGPEARLWDEFNPNRYELSVSRDGDAPTRAEFGLRKWRAGRDMLELNGRPVLLRGTLENAVWPSTGHPPTDPTIWRQVFRTVKDFGMNHLRFHSWCPPEAAFIAADELGLHLQVECGVWSHEAGDDEALNEWVLKEARAILEAYGNHPSFFALAIGNEGRHSPQRSALIRRFLELCREDGRHLYTDFVNTGMAEEVDFAVKPWIRRDAQTAVARDIHSMGSRADFSDAVAMIDIPLIGHETTQIATYPDFGIMDAFTGPLKPTPFGLVRDRLRANGLADFHRELFLASGHFQNAIYKEYIEQALRTPGYAGYQMLGLNDFSGQGSALVGPTDFFWQVKDYTSADFYRSFQSAVVPLARFDRRVWTTGEHLKLDLELAHFGPQDLSDAEVIWRFLDGDGQVMAEDRRRMPYLPSGARHPLFPLEIDLADWPAPAHYRFDIELPETGAANHYDFWVFAPPAPSAAPEGIFLADQLSPAARSHLAGGGTVCLFADPKKTPGIGAEFDFRGTRWNNIMGFQDGRGGKGLIVDPEHPAFEGFPTGPYIDWQWAGVIDKARAVDLSADWPKDRLPLLHLLDSPNTARKLAGIFEARCGGGRILVATLDLHHNLADRPAAALLRARLLDYAASTHFQPEVQITPERLTALLGADQHGPTLSPIEDCRAEADSAQPGFPAEAVLDDDPETIWHSAFQPVEDALPHEIVIHLPEKQPVDGLFYLARKQPITRVTGYEVFVSHDGDIWNGPVLKGRLDRREDHAELRFPEPVDAAAIKFRITDSANPPTASVAKLVPVVDLAKAFDRSAIDPTGVRQD